MDTRIDDRNYRYLDNILFVHYADMLADPACEIRRIAGFLDIVLSEVNLQDVVEHTSLPAMRRRAVEREQVRETPSIFKKGAESFFYKGTNGRWRDVLTEAELAMYEQTKQKVLAPECARWLEEGQSTLT